MKTITNNDDYVRLRVYERDLPIDEAASELLRLERAQHTASVRRLRGIIASLQTENQQLRKALSDLGEAQ